MKWESSSTRETKSPSLGPRSKVVTPTWFSRDRPRRGAIPSFSATIKAIQCGSGALRNRKSTWGTSRSTLVPVLDLDTWFELMRGGECSRYQAQVLGFLKQLTSTRLLSLVEDRQSGTCAEGGECVAGFDL